MAAGSCDGAVVAAPGDPIQDVSRVADWWREDECAQESDEFRAGQGRGTRRAGRAGPAK